MPPPPPFFRKTDIKPATCRIVHEKIIFSREPFKDYTPFFYRPLDYMSCYALIWYKGHHAILDITKLAYNDNCRGPIRRTKPYLFYYLCWPIAFVAALITYYILQ